MANAPRKEGAPADGVTANGPEAQPVHAGGLQPGQKVAGPVTTRSPRGVGEPAANTVADEPSAKALQDHVQNVLDDEGKRGYRGAKREQVVPNENYTLRGVGRGLPTPETTVYTPQG